MPNVCIVSEGQNPRAGYRCWNQLSRPIGSRSSNVLVVRLRKRIEFSNLGRRLDEFAGCTTVLMSTVPSFASPRTRRMAGKSMYKHDTFKSTSYTKITGTKSNSLERRVIRFEEDRQSSLGNRPLPVFSILLVHRVDQRRRN